MKLILYLFMFLLLGGGILHAQLIEEDFEGGIPAGWSADGGWSHGDYQAASSVYFNPPQRSQFMWVNDDAAGNGVNTSGRVTTPELDLTGLATPYVTFHAYFVNGDFQGANERATVEVSTDGGSTWTEIYELDGSGRWNKHFAPLTDFADQKVVVAFTYDDGNGWNFGYCFDDVTVVDYNVKSDAELLGMAIDCPAAVPGVEVAVSGLMANYSLTETVTSFDVRLQGQGVDTLITISDVNVPPFASLTFDLPYLHMVGDTTDILLASIASLSSGEDEDMQNNDMDLEVRAVQAKPGHASVVEEATGTWCTWCPRGHVFMALAERCLDKSFIGIAVHNADPMAFFAYDDGMTSFPNFPGFPSALVDRRSVVDPADIFDPIIAQVEADPVALIDAQISWDEEDRTVNVEASAEFNIDVLSGYRFNMVVVEDSVTGSGSDWAQVNAYSGGGFGVMGGYESLPDPVPASMMVYDHVARALPVGFNGAAGSIGAVSSGNSATYQFDEYTLPAQYNAEHVSIVVMVHDASGRIVGGKKVKLSEVSSSTFVVNEQEVSWSVIPNPFSTEATVTVNLPEPGDVQISMVDMLGKVVMSQRYADQYGTVNFNLRRESLPAGMYNVILHYNGHMAVEKVVIR